MSKASRDKGLVGELEVKKVFEAAGFGVHALEGCGDCIVVGALLPLHLEVKRQETIAIAKWSRQAETEAKVGSLPIVVYRRSREPWRASLLLGDLIKLLAPSDAS